MQKIRKSISYMTKKYLILYLITTCVVTQNTSWTLKSIQSNCPDIGTNEICDGTPFREFTIRGYEGNKENDERWWWVSDNTLGLSNYDKAGNKSGATEIHVREGYKVKIKFEFETKGDNGFINNVLSGISNEKDGIIVVGDNYFICWIDAGGQLSVDIDDDWVGTPPFLLKTHGEIIAQANNKMNSIDDEVFITLLDVEKIQTDNPSKIASSIIVKEPDILDSPVPKSIREGKKDLAVIFGIERYKNIPSVIYANRDASKIKKYFSTKK